MTREQLRHWYVAEASGAPARFKPRYVSFAPGVSTFPLASIEIFTGLKRIAPRHATSPVRIPSSTPILSRHPNVLRPFVHRLSTVYIPWPDVRSKCHGDHRSLVPQVPQGNAARRASHRRQDAPDLHHLQRVPVQVLRSFVVAPCSPGHKTPRIPDAASALTETFPTLIAL